MNVQFHKNVVSVLAVGLGLALMIGESIRSWGMGRPFMSWFDDFILAFFLCAAVLLFRRNPKNAKFLTAAWGINLAMIYISYTSKVLNPEMNIHSTLSFDLLTNLLLTALIVSIIGLIWTLLVDFS